MSDRYLAFFHIESLGRHPIRSGLLEIALVITDGSRELGSTSCVIHSDEQNDVPQWMTKRYTARNGEYPTSLLDESQACETTIQQASEQMLNLIEDVCGTVDQRVLIPCATNTSFQFLQRRFRDLNRCFLTFRFMDVDTLFQIVRTYFPSLQKQIPRRPRVSRALPNAYHAINMVAWYQHAISRAFFAQAPAPPPPIHIAPAQAQPMAQHAQAQQPQQHAQSPVLPPQPLQTQHDFIASDW